MPVYRELTWQRASWYLFFSSPENYSYCNRLCEIFSTICHAWGAKIFSGFTPRQRCTWMSWWSYNCSHGRTGVISYVASEGILPHSLYCRWRLWRESQCIVSERDGALPLKVSSFFLECAYSKWRFGARIVFQRDLQTVQCSKFSDVGLDLDAIYLWSAGGTNSQRPVAGVPQILTQFTDQSHAIITNASQALRVIWLYQFSFSSLRNYPSWPSPLIYKECNDMVERTLC